MFRKLLAFFKLYRADVLLLSFLAFFAGRILGKGGFSPLFLIQAIFISLFPYNFVYTLNSITDIAEDSKNKPWRPLPAKIIQKNEAVLWLLFLVLGSISGTVVLFNGLEKLLIFLIMFFGVSYSLPPLILKKRGILARFVTGFGITYPMAVAGGADFLPFSAALLLHVIGVTWLKDLSDSEGDILAGRKAQNSSDITKECLISAVFMAFSIPAFLFTPIKIAVIMPVFSLFVLFFSLFFDSGKFKKKIYSRIILTTAVAAVVAFSFLLIKKFFH